MVRWKIFVDIDIVSFCLDPGDHKGTNGKDTMMLAVLPYQVKM